VRGIGLEGQIAELVHDEELWLGKMAQPLLEPVIEVSQGPSPS
jgi:hypothetical protein